MRTKVYYCVGGCVVCIFFFGSMAAAQKSVRFSVEGGINIANQSYPREVSRGISKSAIDGVIIGGLIEIAISQTLFLAPEVRYIQKSTRLDGYPIRVEYSGTDYPGVFRLSYIEAAFNLKLKFGPQQAKVVLVLAPALGINVFSHAVFPLLDITTMKSISRDTDIRTTTELLEFSVHVGPGVEYFMTHDVSLFLQGVYSVGAIPVYNSMRPWYANISSNGVQIIGGILFGF